MYLYRKHRAVEIDFSHMEYFKYYLHPIHFLISKIHKYHPNPLTYGEEIPLA